MGFISEELFILVYMRIFPFFIPFFFCEFGSGIYMDTYHGKHPGPSRRRGLKKFLEVFFGFCGQGVVDYLDYIPDYNRGTKFKRIV
jgi:hypothetical protein